MRRELLLLGVGVGGIDYISAGRYIHHIIIIVRRKLPVFGWVDARWMARYTSETRTTTLWMGRYL